MMLDEDAAAMHAQPIPSPTRYRVTSKRVGVDDLFTTDEVAFSEDEARAVHLVRRSYRREAQTWGIPTVRAIDDH